MSKLQLLDTRTTGYLVPDSLAPELKLVFCGTAPSEISAQKKAYYANPGNQFWPALLRVGLIPEPVRPGQYRDLIHFGIGFTDLCKTHCGNDDELPDTLMGAAAFKQKILRYQPKLVAFTSKTAGQYFLNRKVEYGRQHESIHGTHFYVLSSTSGRARRFWREDVWLELAKIVKEMR